MQIQYQAMQKIRDSLLLILIKSWGLGKRKLVLYVTSKVHNWEVFLQL